MNGNNYLINLLKICTKVTIMTPLIGQGEIDENLTYLGNNYQHFTHC
jgi:hypothetical protein